MYASTSFTTSHIIHQLLITESHSRKLLILPNPLSHHHDSPPPQPTATTNNSTDLYLGNGSFDANVVMVLSVLLCALICSLGLNTIIRCALKCSDLVINDDSSSSSSSTTNQTPSSSSNTGIKKKALKTFPIITYESTELNSLDTECVICLSDFTNGEKLRILPKCNHGFHVRCIDKWLTSHSSCPKCRQCLIHTCQKIVGATHPPLPLPQTVITIEPLQQETMVRNYRQPNQIN
ncbi:hypothetical protein PIB30_035883 [Stylosanthes scabra]|uniref:RING-type E3 ubiquitin transferase n=1 Tax=Stylosanthes scabra TaxID=79078 RepID=A0ABU6UFZ5_9FABA|nr:hypothetical protein [Stylosanthes scabra]